MSDWLEFLAARGAAFDPSDESTIESFGAQAQELAAARDSAVLSYLGALTLVHIGGADAEEFLQGQFTNDVRGLVPGSLQLSAWCSPKGRMLANFVLIRWDESTDSRRSFSLVLPRSISGSLTKRLKMFVLRAKVTITEDGDESVIMGIGGPGAGRALQDVRGASLPTYRLSRIDGSAILPVAGPRYIILSPLTQARELWEKLERVARPAGFPSWQWLTIRAGVPIVTPATTDQWVPQMANLDALGGINFQKGCYTGQEIVARTQYLGRLKERLFLLHADNGPAPLAGERLYSSTFGEQACGTVVSAAAAPGGGNDLLAVIQITAAASGDLRLAIAGGGWTALTLLDLPYELPPAAASRTRIA